MKLYGKGTITELIKGKKYRIALSYGKDPITGKYRRYQETFLGTKRQAELRIEAVRRELLFADELAKFGYSVEDVARCGLSIEAAIQSGKSVKEVCAEIERKQLEEANAVTLAEWCEKYLSICEGMGKQRTSTIKKNRSASKKLIDGLGAMKLAEITTDDVNSFYVSMRKNNIGESTIRLCHGLLKRIMNYAVDNDLIPKNPVDRATTPENPEPNRKWLDKDDASRLAHICVSGEPTSKKMAVFLALSLGTRLGETLGLTWSHLKLDGEVPYVLVIQQHTRYDTRTPLKTDRKGKPKGRIIPIDSTTLAALMTWKGCQREQLNKLGIEQGNDTPIITNALGDWQSHAKFEKWWRSFCVDNGFGKWTSDDGRSVVNLVIGDDAALFPSSDYVIRWRDADGWPCDADGRRYSRSHKRPICKQHYEGLHFHSLRHTHYSIRKADGMDDATLRALAGWETDAMLKVYAHPLESSIWKSAGFMDKLTTGASA